MVEGYSEKTLEGVDIFPSGEWIHLIYGIVTPASTWEFDLMIGNQRVKEDELVNKLKSLSENTGKKYKHGIVRIEDMDRMSISSNEQKEREKEMNTMMVVGRSIPTILNSRGIQSIDSIVSNRDLTEVINDSGKIIKDLISIGFPSNILVSDLYLHASNYRD